MKKILFLSLFAGLLTVGLLSFTITKEKHAPKKHVVINKPFTCTANIASFTVTSISKYSVTVHWTSTGTPASYNYGGYYNNCPTCFPGVTTIPTTNTTSTTLTLPINYPTQWGLRVGVVCVCSDGTTVGSTHGVLVDTGRVVSYF
jgi:hypothetical protein